MKHHFVPKFLMKRWQFQTSTGQSRLPAYYWCDRHEKLKMFPAGLNQIGFQENLFSFDSVKDSDGKHSIETNFFQKVDSAGSRVVQRMLDGEPVQSEQDRYDFSVLLCSLDARRPRNVVQLIQKVSQRYRQGLDEDPEIMAQLRSMGEKRSASEIYQINTGHSLEDHALLLVQSITTNPEVIETVMNWKWAVRHFRRNHIVMGDRPLSRIGAIDQPNTVWVLPLSPNVVWFGSPIPELASRISAASGRQLSNRVNSDSAWQCDKYVLNLEHSDTRWLERRLKHPNRSPGPDLIDGLPE